VVCASTQPVLDAEPRDLLEILQIRREYEYTVNQGDRRNLKVHRADAHAARARLLKVVRGPIVKRRDGPVAQEGMKRDEFSVRLDLAADVPVARNEGEPAAPLLFHADDCRADLPIGRGVHAIDQRLAARIRRVT
jgi:hypothetical protein